jgi:hypothetical protein
MLIIFHMLDCRKVIKMNSIRNALRNSGSETTCDSHIQEFISSRAFLPLTSCSDIVIFIYQN